MRFRAPSLPQIAAGLLAIAMVGAAPAVPHLHLEASYPAADDTLHASPDTIRLWFNEEPDLALAAIRIESAQRAFDVGDIESTDDPKSIMAPIPSPLPSGEYRVHWRAAGDDGHVVRGEYAFRVAVHEQEDAGRSAPEWDGP